MCAHPYGVLVIWEIALLQLLKRVARKRGREDDFAGPALDGLLPASLWDGSVSESLSLAWVATNCFLLRLFMPNACAISSGVTSSRKWTLDSLVAWRSTAALNARNDRLPLTVVDKSVFKLRCALVGSTMVWVSRTNNNFFPGRTASSTCAVCFGAATCRLATPGSTLLCMNFMFCVRDDNVAGPRDAEPTLDSFNSGAALEDAGEATAVPSSLQKAENLAAMEQCCCASASQRDK
jgi:hypothetical protein